MKKVLILSYFFPPCNLTGANRAMGWFEHLPKHGIYPVVVTRSWAQSIQTETDICLAAGVQPEVERFSGGEIHRIPFKPSLRDKLATKKNKTLPIRLLQKFLTLVELIFSRWWPPLNPAYSIGKHAVALCEKDPGIALVLISANPYPQFYYGWKIGRRLGIPWIADYRDDWTTNELLDRSGVLNRFLLRLDRSSEKKWVGSASRVVSVSPHYTRKISAFTQVPGCTLLNGFNRSIRSKEGEKPEIFTLLYSGSLYSAQPIEKYITSIIEALGKIPHLNWRVIFQGIAYHKDQSDRVLKAIPELWKSHFMLTKRQPADVAFEEMCEAQVFMMPTYGELKGIPSSKLFEYIAARRTILVFPGDQDIVDDLVNRLEGGIICKDSMSLEEQLTKLAQSWLEGSSLPVPNEEQALNFGRAAQAKELARLIHEVIA